MQQRVRPVPFFTSVTTKGKAQGTLLFEGGMLNMQGAKLVSFTACHY